jgi:putative tricarboxylic transport membrane protein
MIHGIQPGPRLMVDHADLFWAVVGSFFVGNVLLVLLNIPLVNVWVRLLSVPPALLYPAVAALICVGSYAISYSLFDLILVALFGIVGYGMKRSGFPPATLLVGFVLGPLLEENFRRAMLLSDGNLSLFVSRPGSAAMLVLAVAVVAFATIQSFAARRAASRVG